MASFFLKSISALLLFLGSSSAAMVANTTRLREGYIRYHYDDEMVPQCETVVLLGVGTAMQANQYEKLSEQIVQDSSLVFITMDFNPRSMVKLSATKYAKLANAVANQITSLVPACKEHGAGPTKGFVIGGHSAGGQSAMEALPSLVETIHPIAFLGLDPFDARKGAKKHNVTIPGVYWGFQKTTCFVKVKDAARFAYEHTSSAERVFFQVDNPRAKITHCIFTDNGCGGFACPSKKNYAWVRTAVGITVKRFLLAVTSGVFREGEFRLSDYVDVNVYVDGTTIQHVPVGSEETTSDLLPAYA